MTIEVFRGPNSNVRARPSSLSLLLSDCSSLIRLSVGMSKLFRSLFDNLVLPESKFAPAYRRSFDQVSALCVIGSMLG